MIEQIERIIKVQDLEMPRKDAAAFDPKSFFSTEMLSHITSYGELSLLPHYPDILGFSTAFPDEFKAAAGKDNWIKIKKDLAVGIWIDEKNQREKKTAFPYGYYVRKLASTKIAFPERYGEISHIVEEKNKLFLSSAVHEFRRNPFESEKPLLALSVIFPKSHIARNRENEKTFNWVMAGTKLARAEISGTVRNLLSLRKDEAFAYMRILFPNRFQELDGSDQDFVANADLDHDQPEDIINHIACLRILAAKEARIDENGNLIIIPNRSLIETPPSTPTERSML